MLQDAAALVALKHRFEAMMAAQQLEQLEVLEIAKRHLKEQATLIERQRLELVAASASHSRLDARLTTTTDQRNALTTQLTAKEGELKRAGRRRLYAVAETKELQRRNERLEGDKQDLRFLVNELSSTIGAGLGANNTIVDPAITDSAPPREESSSDEELE
jgi:chromosome segregation ATPase